MHIAIILFALAVAAPAAAENLPRFDPAAFCVRVAAAATAIRVEHAYQNCMEIEQEGYDALKPQWSDLSEEIRRTCTAVASYETNGSYQILDGCVKAEAARARGPITKFRF